MRSDPVLDARSARAPHLRAHTSIASLRDVVIRRWIDTQLTFTRVDPKRVYYLSLEYLIGRTLQNAVLNLDIEALYKSNGRWADVAAGPARPSTVPLTHQLDAPAPPAPVRPRSQGRSWSLALSWKTSTRRRRTRPSATAASVRWGGGGLRHGAMGT